MRSRQVVRRIDPWSVLRVAALFSVSVVLIVVLAGILLWVGGAIVGADDAISGFFEAIGFEDGLTFRGGQLLRGVFALGLVVTVAGTGLAVLLAVLFNVVTDVVGGIEVIVGDDD